MTVQVVLTRGRRAESVHVVHACFAPEVHRACHDPDVPFFLRSLAKPFQTLALLMAGVDAAYDITPAELAVISASHGGEPLHVEHVRALLHRGGFTEADLQCGIHAPLSKSERHRRLRDGLPLSSLHSNCSGKHAGMLLHARHLGADPRAYLDPDHPVQVTVRDLISTFAGHSLDNDDAEIDGCGVPTYALTLGQCARAFQRLGSSETIDDPSLGRAVARLQRALRLHPREFSGEGRLPYQLASTLGGPWLSKEGAEGGFAVWGPGRSLIAKVRDGGERALHHAIPWLLHEAGWISDEDRDAWTQQHPFVVRSVAGEPVGSIRVERPEGTLKGNPAGEAGS